ncbi:hypothetical protein GGS23DRAFT_554626 [Durotheca rogersii]|uniref:uncharacterized protein n=1 Tax=Durotheca rogersii TaxID=419775 RepID=UPI00221F2E36|nr:uncharacterized protein GGS23DRAFT_554626 [Durotheca rogersii]KAI5865923.1 hypothetical protein GGS23DRAFT_554626 [Durotheca rogersii]
MLTCSEYPRLPLESGMLGRLVILSAPQPPAILSSQTTSRNLSCPSPIFDPQFSPNRESTSKEIFYPQSSYWGVSLSADRWPTKPTRGMQDLLGSSPCLCGDPRPRRIIGRYGKVREFATVVFTVVARAFGGTGIFIFLSRRYPPTSFASRTG